MQGHAVIVWQVGYGTKSINKTGSSMNTWDFFYIIAVEIP